MDSPKMLLTAFSIWPHDEARWVTGSELVIDGGWTAQ